MVNDIDRSTTCRRKFKAPQLQRKLQKIMFLPKTWVSPNNRLNNSDQILKTYTVGFREQNKGTTKLERQKLKMDLVTRKKLTIFNMRETFRLELSKLLQDPNGFGREKIIFLYICLAVTSPVTLPMPPRLGQDSSPGRSSWLSRKYALAAS